MNHLDQIAAIAAILYPPVGAIIVYIWRMDRSIAILKTRLDDFVARERICPFPQHSGD